MNKKKKVLDYGCGQAAVLSFLIPPTEQKITKMAGIDIDPEVLAEAIERCEPWKADFEQLRSDPLTIDIFQGTMLENSQVLVDNY
jgi:ubiquinone/menaquinone biosynthesis C-methylase UbiE